MDINKLVEVLRATLQPAQREQAEQQLTEVHSPAQTKTGANVVNRDCDSSATLEGLVNPKWKGDKRQQCSSARQQHSPRKNKKKTLPNDQLKCDLCCNSSGPCNEELKSVHKIVGFAPTLLQVVMAEQIDMPVRQSAAIYLKNTISSHWEEKEAAHPTDPVPFSIHENDKVAVREHIVESVIQAPLPIRVQLAVCISQLVKYDYPGKWPGIAAKLASYIQSEQHETWLGSLICLHQLVKNFEYKKPEERGTLNQAMQHLLPMIHQRCVQLLPDDSEASVTLQKQILKIFYALIQFFLPLDLITKETFTQWMELVRQIVDRAIPAGVQDQVPEEDRPELIWWKCKKWALHILARSFERYGSPGNVTKEYNQFSEWYLKSFSAGILQVLLKLLDQYRQKAYIAPRVLQQTLNYLNQGVSHSLCWKIVKPHMQGIVQEIIFPLMCHSEEDEELWQSDPVEYIRVKYDVFEEFFSPVTAAQGLLHSAVSKRKEVLQKTMGFVMQVLTSTNLEPTQNAGALHIVGAVADIILTKKIYKSQAELMIVNHVFPAFQKKEGYLRARACWVLHSFSEVKFKEMKNLEQALTLLRDAMVNDRELPVKVEAAISIQMILSEQEKAVELLRPHVKTIIVEILKVLRETENDDLTSVLQKLVCSYIEEIIPLAIDITTHLAETFRKVLEGDNEGSDEKAIAAMGILNTLETIVTVMEDQPAILQHIEGIVLNVIGIILQHSVMEFYEELLSLIYSLTCQNISERMWNVFPMMYDLFKNDGFDYFTDMMPALHNYITVDTAGFSSNPKHLEIIYDMCKSVLTGDAGEDAECHAAKLLEVLLLQYKGQVDSVIPLFVELALERLTREVRTSELRTMCLQVVIAALYYNPQLLLETLEKIRLPNSNETITGQFVKQWLDDCDCFLGLHDRKMCVLGICCLLDTPSNRPQSISNVAQMLIPAILMVFGGLKRAYEQRAAEENESSADEEEDEDYEQAELEDDDDEIDDEGQSYVEKLTKTKTGDGDNDSESDDEVDEAEETALESYETPLDKDDCNVDEYQIFKQLLEAVHQRDQVWYQALMGGLNQEQKKELQEVLKLAEQRRAAQESKTIEKKGGYVFNQQTVPTDFNFSSPQ